MNEWFFDSAQSILQVGLSCLTFYLFVLAVSKLAGLRSFTTFSGFDFLITLATGALLATTITSQRVSIIEGITAIAALYLFQMIIAGARRRWGFVKRWIDNQPVLLMLDGKVLYQNLSRVKITEDELKSKLRQEGIGNYQQVKTVVLESSGNISVIKDAKASDTFDPSILDGVIRDTSA